jgi:GGDEF domain-containing protein
VSEDFLDPRRAERLTRATRAAQALSEALWEALGEELEAPRGSRVAEISAQLEEVAATVASLARVDARARGVPAAGVSAEGAASEAPHVSVAPDAPAERGACAESEPRRVREAAYDGPLAERPAWAREATPPERPLSAAVLVDELAPARPREIEIRDERGEEGPVAWIGAIGRRLERYHRDRAPFAVLLVELAGVERLRHAEPVSAISLLADRVESALARELRPADALTRESPGRYWLLAPQTDRAGAQLLVERIARAVRASASHRGTPLEVAVGIAVCPDDGREASQLAAHADVSLYAARAAGRPS